MTAPPPSSSEKCQACAEMPRVFKESPLYKSLAENHHAENAALRERLEKAEAIIAQYKECFAWLENNGPGAFYIDIHPTPEEAEARLALKSAEGKP